MSDPWLVLQLATTLPLAGLIAFVQWAHYPLLAEIDRESFPRYHSRYVRRVTPIVAPLMFGEAIGTAGALLAALGTPQLALAIVGLVLVKIVWLSTMFLQVPCHDLLQRDGSDHEVIRRLVRTNALRTAAWILRAALLLYWVVSLPDSRM